MQPIGYALDTVWRHQHGILQLSGCACKLAEDQHAGLGAGGDVLLGYFIPSMYGVVSSTSASRYQAFSSSNPWLR